VRLGDHLARARSQLERPLQGGELRRVRGCAVSAPREEAELLPLLALAEHATAEAEAEVAAREAAVISLACTCGWTRPTPMGRTVSRW
jgi:hypothetical protein